jgi:hypothetical protein
MVSFGQIVVFAIASGDAWLLDASDRLAARLARDGDPEPIEIEDTETTVSIGWKGQYRVEGLPSSTRIGIPSAQSPSSATRRTSSLRWPNLGSVGKRRGLECKQELEQRPLKFQICLVRSSFRTQVKRTGVEEAAIAPRSPWQSSVLSAEIASIMSLSSASSTFVSCSAAIKNATMRSVRQWRWAEPYASGRTTCAGAPRSSG